MPPADYDSLLNYWTALLHLEAHQGGILPVVAICKPPDNVDGPCGLWFCPTITLSQAVVILRSALTQLEPMVNQ